MDEEVFYQLKADERKIKAKTQRGKDERKSERVIVKNFVVESIQVVKFQLLECMEIIKQAPTLDMVKANQTQIMAFVRQYHGLSVQVFGSVARGDATETSDIDLLVNFDDEASIYDHSGLRRELTELLGYEVSIVSNHGGLQDSFRRRLEREAVLL